MTDNEIIKANDLCSKTPQQCKDCPFCKFDDCVSELAEKTIDLINRQQAEIERLEIKIEGVQEANAILREHIRKAVKEFAERLKEDIMTLCCRKDYKDFLVTTHIDNLVKEMAGEG